MRVGLILPYCQVYVATNLKTRLLDERYLKVSMTEWVHPSATAGDKLPLGLTTAYIPRHQMEYVAVYWPDTDVNLLCNDWQHSICVERLDSDARIQLSCQQSKGTHPYPLSR